MNKDEQWQALVKDLWAAYIRMYGFPADGPNVKHAPEWRELWERTEALTNEQPIVSGVQWFELPQGMRLHAPGYDGLVEGSVLPSLAVRAMLDGKEVDDLLAVDTVAGIGWVPRRDERGEFVIDRASDRLEVDPINGEFILSVRPVESMNDLLAKLAK